MAPPVIFKPKAKLDRSQVVDNRHPIEPRRPGYAAYGGRLSGEPEAVKEGEDYWRPKKGRSGVGGGVLSKKPMTRARKAAINKAKSGG